MSPKALSPKVMARFYLPLAATSLLLTATNPLLAAALARTIDPATALAGYSVAFALTGVLYSPLLVVQQITATRLLDGRSAEPVHRFAIAAGFLLSTVALVAAFTPVGEWVFRDLVGVTGGVLEEARSAMSLLWPVPLLTGMRTHHQGRLVAGHRTHPIAIATGIRTGVLGAAAFSLAALAPGAWIGGAAFTLGLAVETVVVLVAECDEPVLRTVRGDTDHELVRFSSPLMLNVMLWWSTPLIINAVLARTPSPEEALAAFAVVEALAWFITAPVGQLQHAAIALVDGSNSHRSVRRWSGVLSVGFALVLLVLALPGVRSVVLSLGFRLDEQLLLVVGSALPLTVMYPLLYGHRQYFQGLFVRAGSPGVVGWGAVLRVLSIVLFAAVLLGPFGRLGVVLGIGLAVLGLLVEAIWLELWSRRRALPLLNRPSPVPAEAVPGETAGH